MKKLTILLSVSIIMLASCCGAPKNTETTATKSTDSSACCSDSTVLCDSTACIEDCKDCPEKK